ncbi:MAG: FHA domain-containing protein [Desulfobacterales bacterium]|nr:FHA domain-containing protein [Desulfobacterales bacterium]
MNMDGKGNIILGNYEIIEDVRNSPVFRWVRAKEQASSNIMLLQLLNVEIQQNQLESLFKFFNSLCSASKNKLLLPEYILSDNHTPIGIVYKDVNFETVSQALEKKPEQASEWWEQVSEQLFYLHNRNLVHGFVSPDNLIVINEKIFLINFGYAPLLRSGNKLAIDEVGEFCAPEVHTGNTLISAADVYAFAKTVVHFHPELKTTKWYQETAGINPENRQTRMRDVNKRLQEIFTVSELEIKKKDSELIIPKYSLNMKAEPEKSGKVTGAGKYMSSKYVTISATSADGYLFDRWKGDLSSRENPAFITMDSDKNITAVFIKDKTYTKERPDKTLLDYFDARIDIIEDKLNIICLQLDNILSQITKNPIQKNIKNHSEILSELKSVISEDNTTVDMIRNIFSAAGIDTESVSGKDFFFELYYASVGKNDKSAPKELFADAVTDYIFEIIENKIEKIIGCIDNTGHVEESEAPDAIKEKEGFLLGISGVHENAEFPLGDREVFIGRDPKRASIIFPNEMSKISRRHAQLIYKHLKNEFILLDLNSKQGTYLSSGIKLMPGIGVILKPGDKFYLASREQTFQVIEK